MIIDQTTDLAGKIRILWQSSQSGNIYAYKFDVEPDEAKLIALCAESDAAVALSAIDPIGHDFSEFEGQILGFLDKVDQDPGMTLSVYNAYLNTLFWSDAAAIRNFVWIMGQKLSARGEIEVSMWTEGTVVREVRDYILSKSREQLNRLIFNR